MFLRKIGKFAAASAIVVLGLVATAGTSFADFVVSASRPVVVADDVNNQITTVLSASNAGPGNGNAATCGGDGSSCSGLGDGTNPGTDQFADDDSDYLNAGLDGTDNPNNADK